MCQAMLEANPAFFQELSNHFIYYSTESYPQLPTSNYAFAHHVRKNLYCPHQPIKAHFHVLIFKESAPLVEDKDKGHQTVPCPFSAFKLLILATGNYQFEGEIFVKLNTAVAYCEAYPVPDAGPAQCRKRLPHNPKTRTVGSQTDLVSSTTFDRFLTVLNGRYSSQFNAIMDSMISGYGSVFTQHCSEIVDFRLGFSNAQCMCEKCLNLI